jgi:hypothetical protein
MTDGKYGRLGRLLIIGKISKETYNQLRREWMENTRTVEAKLAETERSTKTVMVDVDLALVLLDNASILNDRMDEKSQTKLLKILAKRIIINQDGRIIGQELNSPFTYLRSIAESLENFSGSCRDSEQVRLGAPEKSNYS